MGGRLKGEMDNGKPCGEWSFQLDTDCLLLVIMLKKHQIEEI